MSGLLLLRHGQTDWSRDGRIQGRTDTALSDEGRAWLSRHRLAQPYASWACFCSPLLRCLQTCDCLGLGPAEVEPRLAEMDWGQWEGQTLAGLRARLGDAMVANEGRGMDFRPESGESPREVLARVQPWLAERARAAQPVVAVTHRGVIRAVLAWACGWDMLGRPPAKLDWNAAHLFEIASDGRPSVQALNLPLRDHPA